MSSLPLSGIRVVDLTRVYSGPYATFLMAMAGAEVIKVEPPEGESLRGRKGQKGAGLPFAMLNACKKSVTLDLRQPGDLAKLKKLLRTADVIVENFRPGVMREMGLDDEALAALNPKLIRASISGYGADGPRKSYPAMDLTIQAVGGLMEATGFPENPPVKSGAALADFGAGTHLYGGIVTALFHRERTGKASPVEVAMIEAVYPTLASNLGLAMRGNKEFPARTGNKHGGLSLCPYNVYPVADGYVAIICNSGEHWRKLIAELGLQELGEDPRFRDMAARVAHMDEVDARLSEKMRGIPKEELFRRLNAAGVPCGAVRTLEEVLADKELRRRGMLMDIEHPQYGPLVVCGSPIRLGAGKADYTVSAPLGAHNDELLGDK